MTFLPRRPTFLPLLLLSVCLLAGLRPAAAAAQGGPPEFVRLVAQISANSDADTPAKAAQLKSAEEQALETLDRAALAGLNAAAVDLNALNQRMTQFVTRQPALGEGYRLVRLGGSAPVYALAANFGPAGPSAVRIYAGSAGHLELAARIDRFAQPDFPDDFLELVPWTAPGISDAVFVTVIGRTDELQTGIFAAWRFDRQKVAPVWTSDILPRSSYEMAANGFRVTFCGETDPDDDAKCLGMTRERYAWQGGKWTQLESVPVPAAASKP
jgi:hypothetical protein